MVEVVIAGASVAGTATALHLARLGHSVQLLEAAQFPRRKAIVLNASKQIVSQAFASSAVPRRRVRFTAKKMALLRDYFLGILWPQFKRIADSGSRRVESFLREIKFAIAKRYADTRGACAARSRVEAIIG